MKKTESFWTIFATLTGGQKFTVIRNILVLPILLIALELGVGGGLYGIALFPWVVLPFYLWSNIGRGKTLHRLHLPGGFLTRSSKLWVWYLLAGVIGAAYSAAWIGISAVAGASELMMVNVNNAVTAFLAALAVVLGIRKGWSEVIPPEQADETMRGQQVLHLINPKGIAQRQLFFNVAGILVLIGALAQVGQSMAKVANTGTSSTVALTDDDALIHAMASGTTLPASANEQATPSTQGNSDPVPTPGLTLATYGNQVVSHYPGQSPLKAATYALRYLKMPYQLGGIDAAGYVSIEATCQNNAGRASCDDYFSNGDTGHTTNIAGFAARLWPVNPADVQIAVTAIPDIDGWPKLINALAANKIACMGPICFDKAQHVVGRAISSTLAAEIPVTRWLTTGQSSQAMSPSAQAGVQHASTPESTGSSELTANTFGNRVTSFYPGKAPLDAYMDALIRINSNLMVSTIDYLGYPIYEVECEKNGQCVSGDGVAIGSIQDVAGWMFPVDPADISRYRLSCDVICYDTKGNVIGRDPRFKE
ncbi:hypothetical protein [Dyella sp. A6]|uniref:hypothetical protein n=1 Tax=Dyella aluminiiresistens TaxID=3069105 RepID=UPI002E75AC8B|nr:hypothetical protein [Dyella sp. A6]